MTTSRRFTWFTVAILCGIALGIGVVHLKRSADAFRKQQETVQKLHSQGASSTKELQESVAAGQLSEDVANRIRDYIDQIGRDAAALGPEERKSLLAAQRVFTPMAALMAAYEKARKEFDAAGGSSPATLMSQESIQERIAMANRFRQADHALLEFYRSVETNYRAELDKEGLPAAVKSQNMISFRKNFCVDVNLAIRESDEKIAATLLKLLELFNREWGAWAVQPEGELAFDQVAALTEYQVLQDELRAVSARQQAAQKELLSRAEQQQIRPGSK